MKLIDSLIERALRVFERIYPLVRPAAHSVIGKAVVVTGLAVMVGPFWEPYLRAFFEKYLERTIDPPTAPFWGFLLVFSGLVYHLLAVRADGLRKEMLASRSRGHDAPIVRAFQAKVPDGKLFSTLSQIESDHSIWADDSILDDASSLLRAPSTHLIEPIVREKATKLDEQIAALLSFIAHEFFVSSSSTGGRLRLCLRPDWNMDRSGSQLPTPEDEARYENLSKRLDALTSAVANSYGDFIRTAHQLVL